MIVSLSSSIVSGSVFLSTLEHLYAHLVMPISVLKFLLVFMVYSVLSFSTSINRVKFLSSISTRSTIF